MERVGQHNDRNSATQLNDMMADCRNININNNRKKRYGNTSTTEVTSGARKMMTSQIM
jgi:hypothetical protein